MAAECPARRPCRAFAIQRQTVRQPAVSLQKLGKDTTSSTCPTRSPELIPARRTSVSQVRTRTPPKARASSMSWRGEGSPSCSACWRREPAAASPEESAGSEEPNLPETHASRGRAVSRTSTRSPTEEAESTHIPSRCRRSYDVLSTRKTDRGIARESLDTAEPLSPEPGDLPLCPIDSIAQNSS